MRRDKHEWKKNNENDVKTIYNYFYEPHFQERDKIISTKLNPVNSIMSYLRTTVF